MDRSIIRYLSAAGIAGLLLSFVACANIATPSGGDYDFDVPKLVRTLPTINATQVKGNRVVLEFDENIILIKQLEKIIITPPQHLPPIVRSANKKVMVTLNDTLIPNTTYTIDFTDAIADNNEGNVFDNFSFSFSTGDYVDSLAVSGTVLAADNLEPVKGMLVGLHSNLSDTAFATTKFLRISRTNDYGKFTIRGVAPGSYNIFALDDKDRDYKYANPAEGIAFLNTVIVPSVERDIRSDTVTVIHGEYSVDSIRMIEYTKFLPDNILLRSFNSDFARQYLAKHERVGNKINLYFGSKTELPTITPISFDSDRQWAVMERTINNDSITYWVNDKTIAAMDTLVMQVSYLKTDTLNQLVSAIDTLTFVDRTKPKPKDAKPKKKKKGEEPEITFLGMTTNARSSLDIFRAITFEFAEPIVEELSEKLLFQEKRDTTFVDIPLQLSKDSLNPRKYYLRHKWEYGHEYRLSIDSASINSIYGLFNNKFRQVMKVKKEDEYGQFALFVSGINSEVPSFIELMDKNETVVRKVNVKESGAVFKNMDPGIYYARIVIDSNGNGKWDMGDYSRKLQPEIVCYNNKPLEIKANWAIEEIWAVDTLNFLNQKPLEITKNKPKDQDSRKKQMENKDRQNRNKQQEAEDQRRRQTADPTKLNTSTTRR